MPLKKNTKEHFIILKGRIHQEHINIINKYAPKIGAPKYVGETLEDFKKDIDSNPLILGDFNTPLSKMNRSSKQNINEDMGALNKALEQMDLSDIYTPFHPKEAKYTLLLNAHGTFSKIDHMIGHKQTSTNSRNLKSYQEFSQTTEA